MKEVIAKRYIKALKLSSSIEELESFYKILDSISIALLEPRFADIIYSPEVSKEVKVNLILDSIKNIDKKLKNFIKIIGEYKRFDVLPEVTKELRYQLALTKNKFEGKVFTSKKLTNVQIKELTKSFNQKLNTEIVLTQEIGDFNGVKVEIDDLGVEIGFSKDRLQNQIIEHILKAI
jgi:F-type H+-transporting ATPase subunit delta